MTTTDYLQREIRRAELSTRRAERKPNTPPEELRGLHEKLEHLQDALYAVEEHQRRRVVPLVYKTSEGTAHIDREKWEPCEYCQRRTSPDEVSMLTTDENGSETGMFVFNGILASNTDGLQMRQIYFCPICGRPLSEESWAELERRVFGG